MTSVPSVSSTVESHAADEAGGEVIYSSDGLDPLPVPPPPPPQWQTLDDKDSYVLTEDEPLMGIHGAQEALGLSSLSGFRQSSPEERLQRVEEELKTLDRELSMELSLQEQVAHLRRRYEAQLALLQQKQQYPSAAGAAESDASEQEVVAEDLERVMRRLERAIGTMSLQQPTTASTTGTAPARGKGLLDRVALLERAVEQLDDRKLELLARQAKILRSDLQAASRARAKLAPLTGSSGSKGANGQPMDDTKTIATLFNTMTELQDVRQHLPLITERLQALASLHTDASTYSQRLAALEEALRSLGTQVNSVEQSVATLQSTWKQSIETTMRKNLQAIDERLAKVRELK